MSHRVFISREKKGLGCLGAGRLIKKAVAAALEVQGISVPCQISVLLTDDGGIQALNREFRSMDKPTDVLSFPANEMTEGEFHPEDMETDPKTGRVLLGDMAISLERCAAQGEEFGHGVRRELQYLTVHSVLHLLGYDHVDEGEMKRRMRQREKAVMEKIEGVVEE